MSLARKLAKLEVLVQTQAPAVPTFWTPERLAQRAAWINRLLATMPLERAERVYSEVMHLPIEAYGPITVAIVSTAEWRTSALSDYERPLAFPEETCAMLEAHPGLHPRSAHDCEDCGFETPGGTSLDWQWYRDPAWRTDRTLPLWPAVHGYTKLTVCPLCGGAVSWQGFNAKRWHGLWERQKAELAAGR